MILAKFTVFDRSKKEFVITAQENDTLGTTLDTFFPKNQNYTLSQQGDKPRIIDRAEIIKDILKEGILLKENIEYHLINIKEYVDIYINFYTKSILRMGGIVHRIYCTDETTIADVEEELQKKFGSVNIGLYGHVNNKVFKLKPKLYALFVKRCFDTRNFFQLQFNDSIESLNNIENSFTGRFYKIKYVEQMLLFKKAHTYCLKENTLIKMKEGKIFECFYDIDKAVISAERFYGKNLVKIETDDKQWILCTHNIELSQNLYFALLACNKEQKMSREIADTKYEKESDHLIYESEPDNLSDDFDVAEYSVANEESDFEMSKDILSYMSNKGKDSFADFTNCTDLLDCESFDMSDDRKIEDLSMESFTIRSNDYYKKLFDRKDIKGNMNDRRDVF